MPGVTLNTSEPGYVETTGTGRDLVDKEMDLIVNRANMTPTQGAQFFRSVTPRTATHKESQAGNGIGLPVKNEDGAEIPFAVPPRGFPKSLTVVNYRIGVRADRTILEDDQFSKVGFMLSGLVDAGKNRLELAFANIIENGFSGTAGADGRALFANDHNQPNPDAGTWSNLEVSAALTHASYSTSRTNHRKQVQEDGFPGPIAPRLLVVHPDREQRAREILHSEKVDDNALNRKNVWFDEADIFVWDWLTSSAPWFLWGNLNERQEGGLLFVNKSTIRIASINERDPDILMSRLLRMRFITGFTTEMNLRGNAGV